GEATPVGRMVTVPIAIEGVPSLEGAPSYRIVGVVSDARTEALTSPPQPEMYGSIWQAEGMSGLGYFAKHLIVRSTGDPRTTGGAIQRALRALEPTVVIEDVKTLETVRSESVASQSLLAALIFAFAIVACALTMGGLYGMLSLSTASRRRELAIRTAVGADRSAVLRLVLRDALLVVATGISIGLVSSLALGRVLDALLFGVAPVDPITFVGMGAVLCVVTVLACWAPTRRALAADLVGGLRSSN
ncbi:MAG: FtsX-like permease family protein, partial [Longimicrobiales bacterium]|nr:FtsX-like permease family protein [Longimicrobiales bacterium]